MKKAFVAGLALTVAVMVSGAAFAATDAPYRWTDKGKVFDDLSWWAKSGATPVPVKDTAGRSGYWWWPKEPKSNAGKDTELWGNRGVVYAQYKPTQPKQDVAEEPKPKNAVPQRKGHGGPNFNPVLFDFDKSNLKPEGKKTVDEFIRYVNKPMYAKNRVEIHGHTCDIGTKEYNMGLGERRAIAVRKYMVDNGVDAARITVKSYGESQPAVPNDTPANRAKNRRVVFDIIIID